MIDILSNFNYFIVAFLAGIIGALFGIGGGIILVPTLTLAFGLPAHEAIGASIVAVVATSVASTGSYVKEDLVNMRLGMFLEVGTSFGALVGAITAYYLKNNELLIIFSLVLIYAAYVMFQSSRTPENLQFAPKNDFLAEKFHLNGRYAEKYAKSSNGSNGSNVINYNVEKVPEMLGISVGAGIASGLLGVGGGFIKVPALVKLSKLPMKAASATSNFMIGVTASTSAIVYLKLGYVVPTTAVPVAFGTLFGALLGSKLIHYIDASKLRAYFALLLVLIAIRLFIQAYFGI